jgi:hypothetical protein
MLAKQGLERLNIILAAYEAVFCYAHASTDYLRLHLLRNFYQAGLHTPTS